MPMLMLKLRGDAIGSDSLLPCSSVCAHPTPDPTHNINRFYVVGITSTVFGESAVLREWGRRGSTRAKKRTLVWRSDLAEARTAALKRARAMTPQIL
jgi:predicted DNA-binding WGR domain protein